jgi:hypothetical protein
MERQQCSTSRCQRCTHTLDVFNSLDRSNDKSDSRIFNSRAVSFFNVSVARNESCNDRICSVFFSRRASRFFTMVLDFDKSLEHVSSLAVVIMIVQGKDSDVWNTSNSRCSTSGCQILRLGDTWFIDK